MHAIGRLTRVLAAALLGTVFLVAPGAAPAQAHGHRLSLVGSWHALGTDTESPIDNDMVFHRDRTLAIDFPGRDYDGLGRWHQRRNGEFVFYQQHNDYAADGTLIGYTRADIVGRQTGRDTMGGAGPVRSYGLDGELLFELQVTFEATRL